MRLAVWIVLAVLIALPASAADLIVIVRDPVGVETIAPNPAQSAPPRPHALYAVLEQAGNQYGLLSGDTVRVFRSEAEAKKAPDILIGTLPTVESEVTAGKAKARIAIGRVAMVLFVRATVQLPTLATTDDVKAVLSKAIYSTPGSAPLLRGVLGQLGLTDQIQPTNIETIIPKLGNGTGFALKSEIDARQGVQLLETLPDAFKAYAYESYYAAVFASSPESGAATRFIDFLKDESGRRILKTTE